MALLNPNEHTLYDLDLGDEIQFTDDTYALRVPGGWIFSMLSCTNAVTDQMETCFVPFHNEFQQVPKHR